MPSDNMNPMQMCIEEVALTADYLPKLQIHKGLTLSMKQRGVCYLGERRQI